MANDKLVYTVRGSDTLWGIARDKLGDPNRFRDIFKWNGLKSYVLFQGQKLKLYNPIEFGEEITTQYSQDVEFEDSEPTYYE